MTDTPVPLAKAVERFFSDGGVTVSSLRTEAKNGNLAIMRIAGKDFVTEQAVNELKEYFHRQFKAQKHRGEWFKIEKILAWFLDNLDDEARGVAPSPVLDIRL